MIKKFVSPCVYTRIISYLYFSFQGIRPPLVITQQHQQPRELVVLSAAGAHLLTSLRPVDQLSHLLQEAGGPDGPTVREYFTTNTVQACTCALILATDPNMQNAQVSERGVG